MKITKKQLQELIAENVEKVVKESGNTGRGSYMKGRIFLREASYDSNGEFNAESHNEDLKQKFSQTIEGLTHNIGETIEELNYIATAATDGEIEQRARFVINALIKANRNIRSISTLTLANRWDVSAL